MFAAREQGTEKPDCEQLAVWRGRRSPREPPADGEDGDTEPPGHTLTHQVLGSGARWQGDSSGPLPATVPRPRGCSYRPGMPGYELSLPACLRWTVSRAVSLEKISSPLWATARPKFSW